MVKNLLGRDMSNFSISYELCGEHNIGLANSHPDNNLFSTIKLSLIMENGESVDDQLYIAQAIVTRIPSSFWSANKRPMPDGYDMVSIVDNSTDAKLLEVFSTLELLSSNELTIVTAALEENNFYFVEKIKVAQAFRGQGVGTFFAKMLPQWIRMITSEKEPLITVLPIPVGNLEENTIVFNEKTKKLIQFFENAGYEQLVGNRRAMYYPHPREKVLLKGLLSDE